MVTDSFTVDVANKYWISVGYRKIFKITMNNPIPPDEFTAEYEITELGKRIAHGDSKSFPEEGRPWALSGDYAIRFLGSFNAEPGKAYGMSLHIIDVTPALASTNADVIIVIDPHFDEGYGLRRIFLVYAGIGIALVIIAYGCVVLRSHWLIREKSRKAVDIASR